MKLEFWSATTTKTTLKWCHQFGSITGLWTRDPIATASFGMPGTTKNELDNVREEGMPGRTKNKLDNVREEMGSRRKVSHTRTTWDRYGTTLNVESFDMETKLESYDLTIVVPISSDEDIHNKIETNERNKFGRSGGDVSKEEEKASKGQEGSEIIKNNWSSKDKVKSGEYVLNRPPKKPGGEEVDDINTATTITCDTASVYENSGKTITDIDMLEQGEVPNIVRMEKETNQDNTELLPPTTFKEIAEDTFGLPHHRICFMTGKELRDIGDRIVLDAYLTSRGYPGCTDQNCVPRKRKIVKPAMKWKVPADKPKEFKFSAYTNQSKPSWETQTGGSIFEFGNTEAKGTSEDFKTHSSGHKCIFGKVQVKTKKTQGPTRKRRKTFSKPRKINPYVLRGQELKIEESKRAQGRIFNWKRRQELKLERNTKLVNVSEFLRKKLLHKSKNIKKRINTQRQVNNKVTKKPIETIYMLEKEEPCILCLEKRQPSSSAVMFARLRSNRRYKPGD